MSRRITVAFAALAVVVASLTGATAASAATHQLARVHQCKPMAAPVRGAVTGYMIGQHSYPHAPLFYRSVDELTAGLFYGDGGDWVIREWCTR